MYVRRRVRPTHKNSLGGFHVPEYNPALRNDAFAPTQTWDNAIGGGDVIARERSTTMTVSGTAWKSLALLSICAIVAAIGWRMISADRSLLFPFWGAGVFGG